MISLAYRHTPFLALGAWLGSGSLWIFAYADEVRYFTRTTGGGAQAPITKDVQAGMVCICKLATDALALRYFEYS